MWKKKEEKKEEKEEGLLKELECTPPVRQMQLG
jgi:hypothetical protein